MLLTQARLFDEPQLASLCLDTIDKTTSEALSADGFTDVDLETLCAVLERDTLHIRETTLFQAVMRSLFINNIQKYLLYLLYVQIQPYSTYYLLKPPSNII